MMMIKLHPILAIT